MSDIAEQLRQKFQDRLAGEPESIEVPELDGQRIYWKPITGKQQKQIQAFAEKSTAEGICMHVKTRALDEKGERIFKDVAMAGMMADFDFQVLARIFFAMTGTDLSEEDIGKN